MRLWIVGAAALALCACGQGAQAPIAQDAVSQEPVADGRYAFSVDLTFTPEATAKLEALGEKVTVGVAYFGEPKPDVPTPDEPGGLPLGADYVEVEPRDGTVKIPGNVDVSRLVDVIGETPSVNINVYSARKKHDDNLLDCAFFEDRVSAAQQAKPTLACKLL